MNAPRERPLLMKGPLVLKALAGGKTQTRRIIKSQPKVGPDLAADVGEAWAAGFIKVPCPYGAPGDRLWVRETWASHDDSTLSNRAVTEIYYRADCERRFETDGAWRPSIFMPRWACRLVLEVTEVRVQRLQEISEEDAKAEGVGEVWWPETWQVWDEVSRGAVAVFVEPADGRRVLDHRPAERRKTAREAFAALWDEVNGKRASWESDPWVWAISFKHVEAAHAH